MTPTESSAVTDSKLINPDDIAAALTRGPLVYANGATQVFTPDGRTVYTEMGIRSSGEWKVNDDGQFQSFWPPSEYTTYNVSWIVGPDGEAVGIRFTDPNRGTTFDGRYTPRLA